jgi:hypothetical protein
MGIMLNSNNIIISVFAINALQTKNSGFPLNLLIVIKSWSRFHWSLYLHSFWRRTVLIWTLFYSIMVWIFIRLFIIFVKCGKLVSYAIFEQHWGTAVFPTVQPRQCSFIQLLFAFTTDFLLSIVLAHSMCICVMMSLLIGWLCNWNWRGQHQKYCKWRLKVSLVFDYVATCHKGITMD